MCISNWETFYKKKKFYCITFIGFKIVSKIVDKTSIQTPQRILTLKNDIFITYIVILFEYNIVYK